MQQLPPCQIEPISSITFATCAELQRTSSSLTLHRKCLMALTQEVLPRAIFSPRYMSFQLSPCCMCQCNKTLSADFAFKLLSKMRRQTQYRHINLTREQRRGQKLGWFYNCCRTFKQINTLISISRLLGIYCCPISEINLATALITKWGN